MEYIYILPIAFFTLLEVVAIILVATEEILYEPEEKAKKIAFILLVPVIGAVIELRKLDKFARYTKDANGNDVMCYAFWDYYTTSHSSGESGGVDGGYNGGGGE